MKLILENVQTFNVDSKDLLWQYSDSEQWNLIKKYFEQICRSVAATCILETF